MGNCLTINEVVADLTKKHTQTVAVVNGHTSTIQQLTDLQLAYAQLHVLTKDKRRAWEGIYSKDGLSVKISITNTKMVSKKDLDDWMEGNVDTASTTKFRDLYKPKYWFGSSAGSTLRYRFHEKNLELEYKQTVEQMWDSAIEIVATIVVPESALSVYNSLETTEEWTLETTIWNSTQQNLKDTFVKALAPDLIPVRVVDVLDDEETESDDESTMGLPIAVVLEYVVAQQNTLEWKPIITAV